jgi:hypothetical protein
LYENLSSRKTCVLRTEIDLQTFVIASMPVSVSWLRGWPVRLEQATKLAVALNLSGFQVDRWRPIVVAHWR